MTFKDGLDRSNEETKSSWSSSEEALAACEGLIFNEPLNGGTKCRYHIILNFLNQIHLHYGCFYKLFNRLDDDKRISTQISL